MACAEADTTRVATTAAHVRLDAFVGFKCARVCSSSKMLPCACDTPQMPLNESDAPFGAVRQAQVGADAANAGEADTADRQSATLLSCTKAALADVSQQRRNESAPSSRLWPALTSAHASRTCRRVNPGARCSMIAGRGRCWTTLRSGHARKTTPRSRWPSGGLHPTRVVCADAPRATQAWTRSEQIHPWSSSHVSTDVDDAAADLRRRTPVAPSIDPRLPTKAACAAPALHRPATHSKLRTSNPRMSHSDPLRAIRATSERS